MFGSYESRATSGNAAPFKQFCSFIGFRVAAWLGDVQLLHTVSLLVCARSTNSAENRRIFYQEPNFVRPFFFLIAVRRVAQVYLNAS